jgi:hypothetical protein
MAGISGYVIKSKSTDKKAGGDVRLEKERKQQQAAYAEMDQQQEERINAEERERASAALRRA